MSEGKQNKNKYERFHETTKIQQNILLDNDFTFSEILSLINRYKINQKRILDVGCGTGSVDFYLAKRGNKVTGVDISKRAIKACKRDAKSLGVDENTTFYSLDIEKEKLKGKYNVVLCLEVIEHVQDDVKLLKSINNSLKKNGLLILSTPSTNAPLYRMGLLNKFDKQVGHIRRYALGEIENKIGERGFSIVESLKKEGILRNFLFTNSLGSFAIKAINWLQIGSLINKIDEFYLKFFGESDLILVARKK